MNSIKEEVKNLITSKKIQVLLGARQSGKTSTIIRLVAGSLLEEKKPGHVSAVSETKVLIVTATQQSANQLFDRMVSAYQSAIFSVDPQKKELQLYSSTIIKVVGEFAATRLLTGAWYNYVYIDDANINSVNFLEIIRASLWTADNIYISVDVSNLDSSEDILILINLLNAEESLLKSKPDPKDAKLQNKLIALQDMFDE